MNKNTKIIIGVIVLAVIAVFGYTAMTQPDTRTIGEKISDAAEELDSGMNDSAEGVADSVDDAARELEDRTPVERMQDAVEDATDETAE